MTVIAWDGRTLAADKLSSDGTSRRTVTKIARIASGALIATCGPTSACSAMRRWYAEGARPDALPAGQREEATAAWLLAIEPAQPRPRLLFFQCGPDPLELEDETVTMGSGRDYAAAAIHLGHDARTAVEVAIALCPECGQGIDTLTLEP